MARRFLSIVTIVCLAAIPAIAQTRPFNAAGVTAGHEHLAGTDAAAHNAFWTALGAVPAQLGTGTQILKRRDQHLHNVWRTTNRNIRLSQQCFRLFRNQLDLELSFSNRVHRLEVEAPL